MLDSKDSKPEQKPDIVRGELALIVTPELREKLERKIQKRRNERMLREDLRAKEIGEVDLGEIED